MIQRKYISTLGLTYLGMLLYAGLLAILLDGKGFMHDDWAVIRSPYWYEIPQAFVDGAEFMRRPMQSVWFGVILKVLQYNDILSYFISIAVLGLASVMMGLALLAAFPHKFGSILVTLLVFFSLPYTLGGTLHLALDNVRVAAVFYWASVLLFQQWVVADRPWILPLLPALLFSFGLMTYENVVGLPILTTVLVLPVYLRKYPMKGLRGFLPVFLGLVVSHIMSAVLFAYVRSVYNVSAHVPFVPRPFANFAEYMGTYIRWFSVPITRVTQDGDLTAIIVGICVAIPMFFVLWLLMSSENDHREYLIFPDRDGYWLFVAVVFSVSALLPFLWFYKETAAGSVWSGRLFVQFSAGPAMLVGYVVDRWRLGVLRVVLFGIVAAFFGLMTAYHLSIRHDYQEAYRLRQLQTRALMELAPDFEPETLVIFADVSSDAGNAGVLNTNNFSHFQMMYNNRLIFFNNVKQDEEDQWRPKIADGYLYTTTGGVPLDQVVIIERVGNEFRFVDEITPDDPWDINWEEGVRSVQTNMDRVLDTPADNERFRRLFLEDEAGA